MESRGYPVGSFDKFAYTIPGYLKLASFDDDGAMYAVADKNEVRVELDKDKLDRDTAKAADKIGELSAKTVEQIEKLVKKVSPERSSLEGEAASIDTASRTLVLTTGTERVALVVPTTATITSGGQTVALERVPTGRHVRVDLEKRDERWRVTKVEVLS